MALNSLTLRLSSLATSSVTVNLLLRRLFHHHHHHRRPSFPPLDFTTPFPFTKFNTHHRLLLSTAAAAAAATATTTIEAPPAKPNFQVVDYLIQSCGLSLAEAVRASKNITHLKSSDKPDSVLQFLREIGIAESDIRTAVSRDPLILCSSVEKNWRPDIEKLKELSLSTEQLSGFVARHPRMFRCNIVRKVEFWLQTLGSVKNVLAVIKWGPALVCISLENILVPNLTFLQKQLGLPVDKIVRLIYLAPFLIASTPQVLITKAKRAEELGCSSGMFLYALAIVGNLKQQTIKARMNNLRSLGFSQEEVTTIVRKLPFVLKLQEEAMSRKVEFLIREVGCDTMSLIRNPSLFTYSLEKRLIPRNLVRKLLDSKEFPVGKINFYAFAGLNEIQFKKKFIDPYEYAIPGLHQAYTEACSRKLSAKE